MKKLIILVGCLLTGCASLGNRIDQDLHFHFGQTAACQYVKQGLSPEEAIAKVMKEALKREFDQSPKEKQEDGTYCGSGCKEDLKNWRLGAETGVEMCSRKP